MEKCSILTQINLNICLKKKPLWYGGKLLLIMCGDLGLQSGHRESALEEAQMDTDDSWD